MLRRAQDPVVAKLDAATYDDKELTDEDLRAVKKARERTGIPWQTPRWSSASLIWR